MQMRLRCESSARERRGLWVYGTLGPWDCGPWTVGLWDCGLWDCGVGDLVQNVFRLGSVHPLLGVVLD